ncbi:MAG: hypothetical protein L0H53_13430, partial [Candidatus Nitrosocosmicus sp.]|nr:hypothetical protein [Candidatus Nitrosocosmicus sp.]
TFNTEYIGHFPVTSPIIQYPFYWEKVEVPNIDGILFESPLDSTGVIIQIQPLLNMSIEDHITKEIIMIRQTFPNVEFSEYGIDIESITNGIPFLTYTFGQESNLFKATHFMKTFDKNLILFTFYSKSELYDKYSPTVARMLTSFQVPVLKPIFSPQEINSYFLKPTVSEEDTLPQLNNDNILSKKNEISLQNQTNFNQGRPVSYSNYSDTALGIELTYPNIFKPFTTPNGVNLIANNGTLGFYIDIRTSMDRDLEQFTRAQIDFLSKKLQGFSLLDSDQVSMFNEPTNMLWFSYNNNSKLYQGLEFITLNGTKSYVFNYFSEKDMFRSNLDLIKGITDTIDFMGFIE